MFWVKQSLSCWNVNVRANNFTYPFGDRIHWTRLSRGGSSKLNQVLFFCEYSDYVNSHVYSIWRKQFKMSKTEGTYDKCNPSEDFCPKHWITVTRRNIGKTAIKNILSYQSIVVSLTFWSFFTDFYWLGLYQENGTFTGIGGKRFLFQTSLC